MPNFTLVRHRNGDFILSSGSRIPVDAAYVELIVPQGTAGAVASTQPQIQMAASMSEGGAFTSQKQAR